MIYETLFFPDSDPPGVPLIGYDNVVSNITATSEADGFPATNMITPATHTMWKASAAGEQKIAIQTSGEGANYVAIAKHNFTRIGLGFTSNEFAIAGTLQSLLHMESSDTATVIKDTSGNFFGWECNGNAQIDTAQFKFGQSSVLFDGTGDFLRGDGGQFAFGTGDFTIDFWVRINTTGTEKTLIDCRTAEPQIAVLLRITTGNVLQLFVNGTNRITGATALTTGSWFHVALTRFGTDTKLWLNGAQQGSTYVDTNNYVAGSTIRMGLNFSGANGHNGWIDEFRVLKGSAAWNATFTAPTVAYPDGSLPAIGRHELLLYFDGADGSTVISDSGGRNHSFIVHGNAQIDTAQAKFGQSLLLDGTGDFISGDGSEDFTFPGDFTLDFWVRFNSLTGTQVLADWRGFGDPNSSIAFLIFKFTDNTIWMQLGSTGIVGSTVVTTGAWFHVALTRAGSNVRLFVNGTQQGSTLTSTVQYEAGANRPAFGVSADGESSLFLNGWLDEIKVIKGQALWTSNFVPPSATIGTYAPGYAHPIDDTRPIILRLAATLTSALILTVHGGDEPAQAAVIYAGQLMELERGVKWDAQHAQIVHARKSSIVSGMSESGNFLGRVVLSEWREGKAEFAWFTPDWYRENFEPFVAAAVVTPFFWAWNPDEYPEETAFAWLIEDIQPETDPATRRVAATISMRAIA